MNYLVRRLRDIVVKDLKATDGVVLSSGNGETILSTKSGTQIIDSGDASYREGDRVTIDPNTGAIIRKDNVSAIPVYRV